MIDIHNHLLVDLDDGSRSQAQSLGVLRRFRDEGVVAVVCTPHLAASQIEREGEEHIARRDAALVALRGQVPGVELHPGFEIMLDAPLPAVAIGDRRYALAGSRYYLVEFPLQVAANLTTAILQPLAAAGIVPVVAHPERYGTCTTHTLRAWKAAGCAVQVDATTLTRATGRGVTARRYVEAGLADVVAADNHGDSRGIWTGRDYAAARGGRDGARVAELLAAVNPGRIVADRRLEEVPPLPLRRSLAQRLKEMW